MKYDFNYYIASYNITHMLHVWYIFLQNRGILFGQMWVDIPYMEHMGYIMGISWEPFICSRHIKRNKLNKYWFTGIYNSDWGYNANNDYISKIHQNTIYGYVSKPIIVTIFGGINSH